MLVVTIEVWPSGDKSKRYSLGSATLTNVSGETILENREVANEYVGVFLDADEKLSSRGKGRPGGATRVQHAPKYGPWQLLKRFLCEAL